MIDNQESGGSCSNKVMIACPISRQEPGLRISWQMGTKNLYKQGKCIYNMSALLHSRFLLRYPYTRERECPDILKAIGHRVWADINTWKYTIETLIEKEGYGGNKWSRGWGPAHTWFTRSRGHFEGTWMRIYNGHIPGLVELLYWFLGLWGRNYYAVQDDMGFLKIVLHSWTRF